MPLLTSRGLDYAYGQLGSGPKRAGRPHLEGEGRNPIWSSKRGMKQSFLLGIVT